MDWRYNTFSRLITYLSECSNINKYVLIIEKTLDKDHRERSLIFCHFVKCVSSAVHNVNGQHIYERAIIDFLSPHGFPEVLKVPF
jgi:hypothetical protein